MLEQQLVNALSLGCRDKGGEAQEVLGALGGHAHELIGAARVGGAVEHVAVGDLGGQLDVLLPERQIGRAHV